MNPNNQADLPAPWQWPGLWSLNLPALVVLWQILLAQSFFVWLSAYHVFTAAALAWTFLAAERWIYFFRLRTDLAATIFPGNKLPEQRLSVLRICALIVIGLILLGILRMNTRELAGVLMWSSLGGAYLMLLRLAPREGLEFLPRELGLAIYLAGATALFIWANAAFPLLHLLLPVLLFLLLFFYYFCLVCAWAKPLLPPEAEGALPAAQLTPIGRLLAGFLMVVSVAPVVLQLKVGSPAPLLAIGISALILLLVDLRQRALGAPASRIFADVAMLTPVAPIVVNLLAR